MKSYESTDQNFNFDDLLNDVEEGSDVVITRYGEKVAVVVSVQAMENMFKMIEVFKKIKNSDH